MSPNLEVRPSVPEHMVLPRCDVVLTHGGFRAVVSSLLYGVPSLLLPLSGDHGRNARWCAEQGAAVVLDASHRGAPEIRAGLSSLIEDRSYRENAERLRAALDSLPDIGYAVRLLEQLAASGQPIFAT